MYIMSKSVWKVTLLFFFRQSLCLCNYIIDSDTNILKLCDVLIQSERRLISLDHNCYWFQKTDDARKFWKIKTGMFFLVYCLLFTVICEIKMPGNKKRCPLYGGHLVAFHPRDQTNYYFSIFWNNVNMVSKQCVGRMCWPKHINRQDPFEFCEFHSIILS